MPQPPREPTTMAKILSSLMEIKESLALLVSDRERHWEREISPWIRGNKQAATYAGYKSENAFLQWAKEVGLKPSRDQKLNFWRRDEIDRLRENSKPSISET